MSSSAGWLDCLTQIITETHFSCESKIHDMQWGECPAWWHFRGVLFSPFFLFLLLFFFLLLLLFLKGGPCLWQVSFLHLRPGQHQRCVYSQTSPPLSSGQIHQLIWSLTINSVTYSLRQSINQSINQSNESANESTKAINQSMKSLENMDSIRISYWLAHLSFRSLDSCSLYSSICLLSWASTALSIQSTLLLCVHAILPK